MRIRIEETTMTQRDTRPLACELAVGTHWICDCRLTKNPPFCDGSHSGTDNKPCQEVVENDVKNIFWCQCGASSNTPYCDGSHNRLKAGEA